MNDQSMINGSRKEAAAVMVKEILGAGEGVGSKVSGFGVMLTAIWLILEYQSGFAHDEFARLHTEIAQAKELVTERVEIRREAMQLQWEHNQKLLREEISTLRLHMESHMGDCERKFREIAESLEKG